MEYIKLLQIALAIFKAFLRCLPLKCNQRPPDWTTSLLRPRVMASAGTSSLPQHTLVPAQRMHSDVLFWKC
jgi:hypothetical protein